MQNRERAIVAIAEAIASRSAAGHAVQEETLQRAQAEIELLERDIARAVADGARARKVEAATRKMAVEARQRGGLLMWS